MVETQMPDLQTPKTQTPELQPGQMVGRYRIEERVAEIAHTPSFLPTVYSAIDTYWDRVVHIQVMSWSATDWESLKQAARAAIRLESPDLVRVLDFGAGEDYAYVVTEEVAGVPLTQVLRDLRATGRCLPFNEVLTLLRQVAHLISTAPAYTHLSPHPHTLALVAPTTTQGSAPSIMFTELGIFEVARRLAASGEVPPTGAHTQVVALAHLLYALLANHELSTTDTMAPMTAAAVDDALTALPKLNPLLPPGLIPILRRAWHTPSMTDIAPYDTLSDFLHAAAEPLETAGMGIISLAEQLAQSHRRSSNSPIPATNANKDVPRDRAMPPPAQQPTPPTKAETGILTTPEPAAAPTTPPTPPAEKPIASKHAPNHRTWVVKIEGPDGSSRTMPLNAAGLTVGREAGNDLVLPDPRATRRHLRLDFDGATCRICDLGSTNGSFVNDQRLTPHFSRPWHEGEVLRIGGHRLLLLPETAATVAAPLPPPPPTPPPAVLIHETGEWVERTQFLDHPDNPDLGVHLLTPQLQVEPGGVVQASLILLNWSSTPTAVTLTPEGMPPAWLQPPAPVTLAADSQQIVSWAIAPIRSPLSRVGRYRLSVQIRGQHLPHCPIRASMDIRVSAYFESEWDITPEEAHVGEPFTVRVRNQGNATGKFVLQSWDMTNQLTIEPATAELTIPSGEEETVTLCAQSRSRRLLGGTKRHVIQLQLASESGAEPLREYTIIERSRLGLG